MGNSISPIAGLPEHRIECSLIAFFRIADMVDTDETMTSFVIPETRLTGLPETMNRALPIFDLFIIKRLNAMTFGLK